MSYFLDYSYNKDDDAEEIEITVEFNCYEGTEDTLTDPGDAPELEILSIKNNADEKLDDDDISTDQMALIEEACWEHAVDEARNR